MHLPAEILDQVASNLIKKGDIAAAAGANRHWNPSFTRVLYRHVEVTGRNLGGLGGRKYLELTQMTRLVSALRGNPSLGFLVRSITHEFYDNLGRPRVLGWWKRPLRDIQLQLQEIVDRNGFPNVTKLRLVNPDIEIAHLLLKGLCPQLEQLNIESPYYRHLPFNQLIGLPLKLEKLEMSFFAEFSYFGDSQHAARLEADEEMACSILHVGINSFLASSASLRILRINASEGFNAHEIFEGVTLPDLHTLETNFLPCSSSALDNLTFNPSCAGEAATCLASFLDRNLSISRLAVRSLHDYRKTILHISPAASAGIHELVSGIMEVSEKSGEYFAFLRQFTHLRSFKLEYDKFRGSILLTELCEVMRNLNRKLFGVKRLVLPMPSLPQTSRWDSTSPDIKPRGAISNFGVTFKDYLPEVEVFGISQVGLFRELGAAEWAHALAGHPRLRKLAINKSFPGFRAGSEANQEAVDEIAREFSALPQLEQLVFREEPRSPKRAVQVLIFRGKFGVTGKAAIVDCSMVNKVFFDPSLDFIWR